MLRPRSVLLLLAPLLLAGGSAAAQELRDGPAGEPPLTIPRTDAPFVLDGRPDEAAWAQAVVLEGVRHLPDFGTAPSERTEFLLAHDGEYLYMGCRAYERDPSQIRITTLARDVSGYNTDSCGLRLDPFNDEETGLVFITTPASVRTDWSFANDASGPPNQDWNTFWDAEGTLTEYGWASEIRIPFSSLGFQAEGGRVVMGFAVARSIVRNAETIVHPAIPPTWGPSSIAKASQMRKMVLTGVEATSRPVYVTPYALSGGGHTHALNAPRDAYLRDDDRVFEAGGDLRYGITRNLNLDLTLNTDFAQVEADDQQVNLTRFSLFFPEQRRFFQERGAIFEFPLGNNERLFHSRRIGLVEGEQVRIYGGGRLVGRIGDWDVGVLDMQTAGVDAPVAGEPGLPSENMGVLRLRRRVLNPFSYLGGLVTSRVGTDGSYNVLYGSDAVVRLFGQDYLTVNWAQSFDGAGDGVAGNPASDGDGVLDRALARVNWQRRGNDGFVYTADLTRAGAVFEPGLGFLRRRDYLSGAGRVGYGWRAAPGGPLNRYSLGLDGSFFRRNADDSVESAAYALEAQAETRGGHALTANLTRSYEDLLVPFALAPEVRVPVGSYWFTEAELSYSPPSGGLFRPSGSVSGGRFYDGTRLSASVTPNWSVSRNLSVGGTYQINHIDFDARGQTFTSHVARLRTDLTFTTRTSASAFVQYNSTGDLVGGNFRFRYNPSEGTDLYLVWNEALNSDRFALRPVAPLSQERTILLKYQRTFTLGI